MSVLTAHLAAWAMVATAIVIAVGLFIAWDPKMQDHARAAPLSKFKVPDWARTKPKSEGASFEEIERQALGYVDPECRSPDADKVTLRGRLREIIDAPEGAKLKSIVGMMNGVETNEFWRRPSLRISWQGINASLPIAHFGMAFGEAAANAPSVGLLDKLIADNSESIAAFRNYFDYNPALIAADIDDPVANRRRQLPS